MSRVWPTAEMACSVTASRGRDRPRPRVGSPAAIAPLVTITTRWPSRRSRATSRLNFATASRSISPDSSVIDEVPTFATMITGSSPRALLVVLVLERQVADADGVPRLHPGPGERSVDAEAPEAPLCLGLRVGARQVGERHRTDGLTTLHHPLTAVPAHRVALRGRPQHDVLGRCGQLGAGAADGVSETAPQLVHTPAGDGRDPQVEVDAERLVTPLVEIGPTADDQAGTVEQLGLVGTQLVEEDREL